MSSPKANGFEYPELPSSALFLGRRNEGILRPPIERSARRGRRSQAAVRDVYWSIERAARGYRDLTVIATTPGWMLKSALGCNREYFYSQTPRDSNRLQAGGTRDFI